MNPENTEQSRFDPDVLPVQTAQTICCALIAGVLIFAAIVVANGMAPNPPGNPFMAYLAAGFAVMSVVARIVVPNLITRAPAQFDTEQTQNQGLPDEQREAFALFGIYQTRMIVGLALLEGAAFFNVIAYLIEGHIWSLGIVGGLLILMLISYPTRGRVAFWIEDRLQTRQME